MSLESRLYPLVSKVLHQCFSNVKLVIDYDKKKRDPDEISVVATVPIKRGEALSQFYGRADIGTYERQRNQLDNYFFSCQCQRCLDPTELGTYLSAIKCPAQNCPGYLLSQNPLDEDSVWACDQKTPAPCGTTKTYSPFIYEILNDIECDMLMLVGARPDTTEKAVKFASEVEDLLKKYSGVTVHPNHYGLLSLKFDLLVYLYAACNPELPPQDRMERYTRMEAVVKDYLGIYDVIFPGLTTERGEGIVHIYNKCQALALPAADS
jgi:hypothetical protein